ncbi:uncharacterized protein METZ01_LOCUS478201 [marine metagenome]|uniref:Uncharacterized protein n=1 Tax=marine metagenome TaxID=408172 RepID=A0A383BYW3_9ZZZZ
MDPPVGVDVHHHRRDQRYCQLFQHCSAALTALELDTLV